MKRKEKEGTIKRKEKGRKGIKRKEKGRKKND
jgi:hypothetical protein